MRRQGAMSRLATPLILYDLGSTVPSACPAEVVPQAGGFPGCKKVLPGEQ